jgi:hypothetical protein
MTQIKVPDGSTGITIDYTPPAPVGPSPEPPASPPVATPPAGGGSVPHPAPATLVVGWPPFTAALTAQQVVDMVTPQPNETVPGNAAMNAYIPTAVELAAEQTLMRNWLVRGTHQPYCSYWQYVDIARDLLLAWHATHNRPPTTREILDMVSFFCQADHDWVYADSGWESQTAKSPKGQDQSAGVGTSYPGWGIFRVENTWPIDVTVNGLRAKCTMWNALYAILTQRAYNDNPGNWAAITCDQGVANPTYKAGEGNAAAAAWVNSWPWGNKAMVSYLADVERGIAGKLWP